MTLDWVAMTAAVVVLGIGIAYAVYGPSSGLGVTGVVENFLDELGVAASNIDGYVADQPVPPPLLDENS